MAEFWPYLTQRWVKTAQHFFFFFHIVMYIRVYKNVEQELGFVHWLLIGWTQISMWACKNGVGFKLGKRLEKSGIRHQREICCFTRIL